MKVYTKDIKRQAKRSLAWASETDSILIKGKRERFLECQTGCLKRFDGMKLNRRKYISISKVISLSYIYFFLLNGLAYRGPAAYVTNNVNTDSQNELRQDYLS